MLWRFNQGTLLYLSAGAGRGLELTRIGPFKYFQEYFNCLRFTMRSEKNVLHGVDRNKKIAHFVPPSLSRYIIILNLVIYPAVEQSQTLTIPSIDRGPEEANLMCRDVLHLDTSGPTSTSDNGTKHIRDIFSQIMNVITPVSTGKFTTSKENATQLHHSPYVHSQHYSSEIMMRLNDSDVARLPFSIAVHLFKALGETVPVIQQTSDRNFTTIYHSFYDQAAKRALNDTMATCYPHQMEAIKIIDDRSDHRDVVVHLAPGQGKSGIWNFSLLGRAISGSVRQRSIVICPYNSLLAQQQLKSKQCFHGTNIRVYSITTSSLPSMLLTTEEGFDLLYISIAAFNNLCQNFAGTLDNWGVQVIYVDEFHLALTECYRHATSWQSLRDLKSLNSKIVLLSATTNPTSTTMVTNYTGMGDNYIAVGGSSSYAVPNIAFLIERSANADLIPDIVEYIKSQLSPQQPQDFAIHVITVSKEHAMSLTRCNKEAKITAEWLTSDCTADQRERIIDKWDAGKISVLASTYCVGLDNSKVKQVIIMGGCRSAADALQSAGRIRPSKQMGDGSHVIFWRADSIWMSRNDDSLQSQEYRVNAHFYDAFSGSLDKVNAKAAIASLYESVGLDGIFSGETNQCIMKGLHSRMGVHTQDCKMCQHCKSGVNHQLATASRRNKQKRYQEKLFVQSCMADLINQCVVCDDRDCDGFKCVVGNDPSGCWCRRCMGFTGTGSGNFHTNTQCRLSVNNTNTEGKSCPFCFMAVGDDIAGSGSLADHQQGKCILKDRVKRVLLDRYIGATDKGTLAKMRMDSALQSHELWFELMAENLKKIYANKNR